MRIGREIAPGRWAPIAPPPAAAAAAAGGEAPEFATDAQGFFLRRATTSERVRLRARWLRPTRAISTSTDLVVR